VPTEAMAEQTMVNGKWILEDAGARKGLSVNIHRNIEHMQIDTSPMALRIAQWQYDDF
jgi:hypothetical protein